MPFLFLGICAKLTCEGVLKRSNQSLGDIDPIQRNRSDSPIRPIFHKSVLDFTY